MCRKVGTREKGENCAAIRVKKTSHQRNGFVAAVHEHVQGLARIYQTQIKTNTDLHLTAISPAVPFAVRYAGFVLTRFTVRPDGRKPFQYLIGAPHASALCVFGESIFAWLLDREVRASKLTNRWICVGCAIVKGDHAPDCGVAQGVIHGVFRHHGRNQEEVEEELEKEVERQGGRRRSNTNAHDYDHG